MQESLMFLIIYTGYILYHINNARERGYNNNIKVIKMKLIPYTSNLPRYY